MQNQIKQLSTGARSVAEHESDAGIEFPLLLWQPAQAVADTTHESHKSGPHLSLSSWRRSLSGRSLSLGSLGGLECLVD